MRRCALVLSLLVAAGTAFASTPAHAEPMCSGVRVEGAVTADLGDHCVWGYPYGQWCDYHHTWTDGDEIHAYWYVCYPGIV